MKLMLKNMINKGGCVMNERRVDVELYYEALGHKKAIKEHYYEDQQNPLVKMLPELRTQEQYFADVENNAIYNRSERFLSKENRFELVNKLDAFRIVRPFGYMVDMQINSAIRKGYKLSVPNTHDSLSFFSKVQGDTTAFTLMGPSGSGKSTALMLSLYYYPQKIVHSGRNYRHIQVVYIKVDAPPHGSMKSFYDSCLHELEKAADFEIPDKNRAKTADAKRDLFIKQCNRFSLGLLVIDEVQNLLSSHNWTLVNQFLTLSNELMVPIVYVGTDEMASYFNSSQFRTKRRFGLEMHSESYDKDYYWDQLMETLWPYQWLSEPVTLTQEFKDVFFRETGGIIDRVIKLYKIAQQEAIMTGFDNVKKFTPKYISYISGKYFRMSRESLNKLSDPEFPNRLLHEADLKGMSDQEACIPKSSPAELTTAYKEIKDTLADPNNHSDKMSREAMKSNVSELVKAHFDMSPYIIMDFQIEDAVKKVLRDKRKKSNDEQSLAKAAIKLIHEYNNKSENVTYEPNEDFPVLARGEV